MPKISDEQVEENIRTIYRHIGFLPDSVSNLPSDAIREMFDRGELVETEDGDIVQISKETQVITEAEKINHDALIEEQKYYEWLTLSDEEKLEKNPIKFAEEQILKQLESESLVENLGEN